MPHIRSTAIAVLLLLASFASDRARAQCRLSSAPGRPSVAIEGSRALTPGYALGLPPHVDFHVKTSRGWEPHSRFVVGDQEVFVPIRVAMDGDRAIAGCAESTGTDWLSGRVTVFDLVGDAWIPTELVSATNGYSAFFGAAVDVDGDVAIVLATHPYPFGDNLPRVHVFEFDGVAWHETAQIPHAGAVIAVDGDTIALGDDSYFPGHVDVYHHIAGLWTWTSRLRAIPPSSTRFGNSVAIEGDRLVVGACQSNTYLEPGFVDVFRRQGTGYLRVQRLTPLASANSDDFGRSVALSGSTLLVGAPGSGSIGGHGAVHRFEHDGTSFVEVSHFEPELPGNGFGEGLAFHREDAIVASWSERSFYRLGFAHTASFCPTTPNSTGSPASLAVEGCDSLAGERLTLIASGLPAGVLGQFLAGTTTTQLPFGDGFRCVGDPFFRIPGGAADAAGALARDLDFGSSPASSFTVGSTWHFQAVYRDPAVGGAHLNLSDALSVRITP